MKLLDKLKDKTMIKRILMTILGVSICGVSVGFFSYANFGVDPYQVLVHGLFYSFMEPLGLNFGTWYAILNAATLVVIFIVNKKKIGLGTFINLFLLGYIVDFSERVLRHMIGDEPSMAVRIICLAIGIIVMCLSSALYFTAYLVVSTYDAIAITIDEKTPEKIQFRFIRIATDLVCVIVGGILGGVYGVGTIITAFFMGPLITVFNETVAKPLLYGKRRTNNA